MEEKEEWLGSKGRNSEMEEERQIILCEIDICKKTSAKGG